MKIVTVTFEQFQQQSQDLAIAIENHINEYNKKHSVTAAMIGAAFAQIIFSLGAKASPLIEDIDEEQGIVQ